MHHNRGTITYLIHSPRIWHIRSQLVGWHYILRFSVSPNTPEMYRIPSALYIRRNPHNGWRLLCMSVPVFSCISFLLRTWYCTTSSRYTHHEIKVTLTLPRRLKIYPTYCVITRGLPTTQPTYWAGWFSANAPTIILEVWDSGLGQEIRVSYFSSVLSDEC